MKEKGQDDPRGLYERGFCLSLTPTAWGRAICMLKCNTVYLARYRSMRIPISFQTAYARANKQILATDNFIHPQLIQQLGLGTQHLP